MTRTLLVACLLLLGCEPRLVVGKWSCEGADSSAGGESNAAALAPVTAPWSTGFENGFCDYEAAAGHCYVDRLATFDTVTSPVHSGKFAAAFSLNANGLQARCFRQGQLPDAAYYSAFFYIPSAPIAAVNWNLIHFRGGTLRLTHGLWDVSLTRDADGSLHPVVFDFLRQTTRATTSVPAIPIGEWFQLEVFLKRANDATGEFALYQDGQLALELKDLVTDDSSYGHWYVGNLALSLTPADATLYVDDVSIRETP